MIGSRFTLAFSTNVKRIEGYKNIFQISKVVVGPLTLDGINQSETIQSSATAILS